MSRETRNPRLDVSDVADLEQLRDQLSAHIRLLEGQVVESKALLASVEVRLAGVGGSAITRQSATTSKKAKIVSKPRVSDAVVVKRPLVERAQKRWTMEEMLDAARNSGEADHSISQFPINDCFKGEVLAFKIPNESGYYVLPERYEGYPSENMQNLFDGIPNELVNSSYIRTGNPLPFRGDVFEIIELPRVGGVELTKKNIYEIEGTFQLKKGKVKLTGKGAKELSASKEVLAGPSLKTEKELRASDWKLTECGGVSCFASPDGKWLAFTPTLEGRGKPDYGPHPMRFGRWKKLDDNNYVAAYVWRERLGDFNPDDPYDVRDAVKIEILRSN